MKGKGKGEKGEQGVEHEEMQEQGGRRGGQDE